MSQKDLCPVEELPRTPSAGLAGVSAVGALALSACVEEEAPMLGQAGQETQAGINARPVQDHEASRFLSQAAFGGNASSIATVVQRGYEAWLNDQIQMPVNPLSEPSHTGWLKAQDRYTTPSSTDGSRVWANSVWRKTFTSPRVLRQRMVLALSELLVVSMDGLLTLNKANFAMAHYADLLETHAFGKYRDLLEHVTLSSAMGTYLSMKGNKKADPQTSRVPDENFAREIMQLFTIGLHQLNDDGTQVMLNGGAVETYTNVDIQGVAAALTGWDVSTATDPGGGGVHANAAYQHMVPMVPNDNFHEMGAKQFLGVTIPGGTGPRESLRIVLDTLCNHQNTPPFVSKYLIQRFVTSNPSPAYVGRVAAVFKNNGRGERGDLGAVVKAVLLDQEARGGVALLSPIGKLREPMIRLMQWARTFDCFDATVLNSAGIFPWQFPLTHTDNLLSQSPFLSPSVFNFFRPGYVPPNGAFRDLPGKVAPEFQIAKEPNVAAYINFMMETINNSRNVKANYSAELVGLAVSNPQALLDRLNLWLTGNQLSANTVAIIKTAMDSMRTGVINGTNYSEFRLYTAILLIMSSPEYLIQK